MADMKEAPANAIVGEKSLPRIDNRYKNKSKTVTFPLPLIIIEIIAILVAVPCGAEIFARRSGESIGLIPTSLQIPLLSVAVVVIAICWIFQIPILLRRLAQEKASQSQINRSK